MKNKIILAGVHGRPSTKLAFSTMGSDAHLIHKRELRGEIVYRHFRDKAILTERIASGQVYLSEYITPTITLEDSVVIRWGTREVLPTNGNTVIYNKATPLNNASNKRRSRELFIREGVNAPKLVQGTRVEHGHGMLTNAAQGDFPIIARPHTHSRGHDFVILRTMGDFMTHWLNHNRSWYYSSFIDKDSEFRIHVAHGKVLAVMEKPRPGGDNIAWNMDQNDPDPFSYVRWNNIDQRGLKPVLVEAIKAVDAVCLDFGGVDVMLADGVAYVLEVNTAPSVDTSPYVASKYGQYFDWLFRKEDVREHWGIEILEEQYGKTMIWKNWQLRDEERE